MRRITVITSALVCVLGGPFQASTSSAAAVELRTVPREQSLWLDRITYGPKTATVQEYLKLGQRRFLDQQLHPPAVQLPPSESAALLAAVFKEQQRINALTDDSQKQADRKALNDRGSKLAYEAA